MRYLVKGTFGKEQQNFELEVEAKSDKHARELAITKLGSKNGLLKGAINIKEVTPAK